MNTEGQDTGLGEDLRVLSLADRWIQSRFQRTANAVNEAITGYRFDLLASALYEFTWNEYCDWYLELSKPVLTGDNAAPEAQRGTRYTLVQVLEGLLRLAHPLIPFISEEIWQRVAPLAGKPVGTLMNQPFPVVDSQGLDPEAEAEMQWLMAFILGLRNIRGEMNLSPAKPLPILLQHGDETDRQRLDVNRAFLMSLARLASITWLAEDAKAPPAATALVGGLHLYIPLAGLIDAEAEAKRLDKEIDKLRKDLQRTTGKLTNSAFVGKAPPEVVAKERERATEMGQALEKLAAQRAKLAELG